MHDNAIGQRVINDFHHLEGSRPMIVRPTAMRDLPAIESLYRCVAATPGGIARLAHEVTAAYVDKFLSAAIADGVALVATDTNGDILAEIHASCPGLFCFSHVLSDLTIVVNPSAQENGVGRMLFEAFLNTVRDYHPHILRVELIARESNRRALRFYASLGFRQEGELVGRIRNPDGSLESDIPMAWHRNT